MSVRLQNISSHLKKDTYEISRSAGISINTINEEETAQLRCSIDTSKDDNPSKVDELFNFRK